MHGKPPRVECHAKYPLMAEPFKTLRDAGVVRDIGARLQAAWPAFERADFERLARNGLADLELKARAMHLTAALEATLPADFGASADLLDSAIAGGLSGWALWPVGEYVARHGQEAPERALRVLHGLTQ